MNIRELLKTSSPSLELQQAALAEIIRLDAIIDKLQDITVRRYLDGAEYDIPSKLATEFNADIEWVLEDESDERWDTLDTKYNKYKV